MALKRRTVLMMIYTMMFFGCFNENNNETIDAKGKVCPQCNMPISNVYHEHTGYVKEGSSVYYFDDPGCMVLWLKEQGKTQDSLTLKVYSNDSFEYIDAKKAFYAIDDETPMNYGFAAYKEKKEGLIAFEKMRLRMLRGEHLANPKIRKQILGY